MDNEPNRVQMIHDSIKRLATENEQLRKERDGLTDQLEVLQKALEHTRSALGKMHTCASRECAVCAAQHEAMMALAGVPQPAPTPVEQTLRELLAEIAHIYGHDYLREYDDEAGENVASITVRLGWLRQVYRAIYGELDTGPTPDSRNAVVVEAARAWRQEVEAGEPNGRFQWTPGLERLYVVAGALVGQKGG